MTDVHEPEIRSYNMSRIRSRDTKPELMVRKYLFSRGLRYKLNDKHLPGKPDLSFPKFKTVVFINGCFWHGHRGCRYFVIPRTRTDWWKSKISKTRERDQKNQTELEQNGWKVITIWECELKSVNRSDNLDHLYQKICQN